MALSRFEARREAVLNEANAIGTTALRARLLPAPHNAEALKVLRRPLELKEEKWITAAVPRGRCAEEKMSVMPDADPFDLNRFVTARLRDRADALATRAANLKKLADAWQ